MSRKKLNTINGIPLHYSEELDAWVLKGDLTSWDPIKPDFHLHVEGDLTCINLYSKYNVSCEGSVEVMNRLIAKNISINNDLYIKGQLTCEKLSVGGDVTCLSEAEINGEADIKGYLNCAFSVRFKGDATIGKFSQGTTLSVETKISIRNGGSFNQIIGNQITINGSCNCFQSLVAKKFTCTGTLYWGLAHKPHIPHDSVIGRVYPTGQQWAYWRERLGIHFERYKDVGEIFNNITPMIPELLQDPKWTETERWILESHLPKHVALN